uniref:Uncharacterized protein n=1 Tax=Chenopodium quinoa TaxID=63459 RepID=A0A803NDK0_CHEQI
MSTDNSTTNSSRAMDEKQKESITAALNELALRKADLDENVRLTNDLKEKARELRNLTQDPYYEIGSQPSNVHVESPYQQMWVRHLQDGTRHYIEGATNPEYVVTADDVDKCIAVECIPMDENGRQGELVRRFANDQNKITCDPDMQAEIDSYITKSQADFGVLVLLDSFNHWEPATFILRRSGFQVKINKTGALQIADEFSENLSIKIPGGLSTQFVLTCSDVTSHPLSTYNDIRMRDTLVLTIRMFQSKF